MKVYRIQNKKGDGPYTCDDDLGCVRDWPERLKKIHYCRPVPWQDFNDIDYRIIMENKEYFVFAFKDYKQYLDWFTQEARELLREKGFKLYIFEVPHSCVRFGKNQVAFNKNRATLLKKKRIE